MATARQAQVNKQKKVDEKFLSLVDSAVREDEKLLEELRQSLALKPQNRIALLPPEPPNPAENMTFFG